MRTRFLKTAALMILATASAFALADDLPTRVGRISLVQGQVGISAELGDETETALVNWPVTSNNQISTGRDSRTEVRIGSTALRLDADTSIDVNQLEDNALRITLHYGSLSIRVRNAELAQALVLDTPEGTVRMQEPGRIRVDAGRTQDTTTLRVFDGVASFDGTGSRLIVRAGKRADIGRDDLRTGVALRDSFDEWGMLRDARDERSESVRYVTSEMTGYEDLDQHGAWSEDREYGPVWYPRSVAAGWVPYRDGRWTYLQPWGWTWVDNSPWGYAPFHYGRWVTVGGRWCWSPGRNVTRAVWSPALVGWVGGNNWNVSFNSGGNRRAAPATGWYPLTPRDTYVPTYRVNHDNLRYLNRNAGDVRDDIRGRNRPSNRQVGLTVVPHDQFSQRGTVVVPTAPRAIVSTSLLTNVPSAVPPAPQYAGRPRERGEWRGRDRDGDGRPDRRFERDERGQAPVGLQTGTPAPRPSTIITLPSQPQQPQGQVQAPRRWGDGPDPMRRENTTHMPTPAPALPPQMQTPPASLGTQRTERNPQAEPERERPARGPGYWPQQHTQRQPQQGFQVQQPQPQAQPQQRVYQQPQPAFQSAPPQRSAPPSMPPPQMQQQQAPQQQSAPRQQAPAPVGQQPAAEKPAPSSINIGIDEGRRRGMRDSNDRR
ncbi:DUF6600 domain-containing protein [Massilia sp. CF038]|uniref:DUF6600 domain-containing protein n=1 Tax=Massilia sp. CF038 TaxID=1881045 RepID=UPI0009184DB6|nr:DUF6600 domain-containing protein [Massilia sp. CF038]SHH46104.1 FecR family protein [Massilia sp. CF038]